MNFLYIFNLTGPTKGGSWGEKLTPFGGEENRVSRRQRTVSYVKDCNGKIHQLQFELIENSMRFP